MSTYDGNMADFLTGLRSLPHDHVIITAWDGIDDADGLLPFLDRLRVSYEVLLVSRGDILEASSVIEKAIRQKQDMGWRVRVDITGGRKLLSDSAVLAAISTGSEICCFEGEARHISLLAGLGISERLPSDVVKALIDHDWPVPLERTKGADGQSLGRLLFRMKNMDLIEMRGAAGQGTLALTQRGQASLDWLKRLDHVSGSSE